MCPGPRAWVLDQMLAALPPPRQTPRPAKARISPADLAPALGMSLRRLGLLFQA
ncbi:hypothetical protein RBY4I_4122 [Rhodobacterales bacterium Y4I]|nr:hypothetical protein RBY4I_4122 [Rhodobacterales bacterium Y4I]